MKYTLFNLTICAGFVAIAAFSAGWWHLFEPQEQGYDRAAIEQVNAIAEGCGTDWLCQLVEAKKRQERNAP